MDSSPLARRDPLAEDPPRDGEGDRAAQRRGGGGPPPGATSAPEQDAGAAPSTRWPAYARVPPFLPVPLRARADGWTPERQARFIGLLAETGSVAEAARRVGMSRESAWRLRHRAGAASFAHAWNAVIALHQGKSQRDVDFPKRKITPGELAELADRGPFHVTLRRGRFVRAVRRPSVSALLRHLRRLDAAAVRGGWEWP